MLRATVTALLFLVLAAPLPAQPADGTIISREAVTIADDISESMRATLERVTLERIIYASDGLAQHRSWRSVVTGCGCTGPA